MLLPKGMLLGSTLPTTTSLRGWDITVISAFWQITDDFMNLGFPSSGQNLVCGIRYSCVLNIGKEAQHPYHQY